MSGFRNLVGHQNARYPAKGSPRPARAPAEVDQAQINDRKPAKGTRTFVSRGASFGLYLSGSYGTIPVDP